MNCHRSTLRRSTAALAVVAVMLAGCGGGDDEPADATSAPADDEEVVLRDFAFDGLPDTAAPGTRFTVINEGG